MKQETQVGEAFRARGWEVVEGIFAPQKCEAIAELAGRHVDMHVERKGIGVVEARKVGQPFLKDQAFRDFILNPDLLAVLRVLLGGREPLLCTDQIFMKPPHHGSPKHYHQDNAYFQCEPAGHVITAWVALDDADPENGCLRYIDGSHLEPPLEHHVVPEAQHDLSPGEEQIDLDRESCAPVKRGGVVFHHSNTLHASGANDSARWRRAYASHWVTAGVTSRSKVLDSAYFKRDDYPRT